MFVESYVLLANKYISYKFNTFLCIKFYSNQILIFVPSKVNNVYIFFSSAKSSVWNNSVRSFNTASEIKLERIWYNEILF